MGAENPENTEACEKAKGEVLMQWISVKDRLPEREKPVLALSVHGQVYSCWYRHGEGFFPYAHMENDVPLGVVTHWMPMPTAPHK